jgi:hypothetical protein
MSADSLSAVSSWRSWIYREASRIVKSRITGLTGTAKVDRFFFGCLVLLKIFQTMTSMFDICIEY